MSQEPEEQTTPPRSTSLPSLNSSIENFDTENYSNSPPRRRRSRSVGEYIDEFQRMNEKKENNSSFPSPTSSFDSSQHRNRNMESREFENENMSITSDDINRISSDTISERVAVTYVTRQIRLKNFFRSIFSIFFFFLRIEKDKNLGLIIKKMIILLLYIILTIFSLFSIFFHFFNKQWYFVVLYCIGFMILFVGFLLYIIIPIKGYQIYLLFLLLSFNWLISSYFIANITFSSPINSKITFFLLLPPFFSMFLEGSKYVKLILLLLFFIQYIIKYITDISLGPSQLIISVDVIYEHLTYTYMLEIGISIILLSLTAVYCEYVLHEKKMINEKALKIVNDETGDDSFNQFVKSSDFKSSKTAVLLKKIGNIYHQLKSFLPHGVKVKRIEIREITRERIITNIVRNNYVESNSTNVPSDSMSNLSIESLGSVESIGDVEEDGNIVIRENDNTSDT